ncbi:hypothetical protein HY375_02860 [Candidatus Berkelbacteria bacterium]|nr:hypothetical protein [Candidatus Berkelbacteria bacterium]
MSIDVTIAQETETRTITHMVVQARIAWPNTNGWEIGLTIRGELEPNQWCKVTVSCEWYFDCTGCVERGIPHCTHHARWACPPCQERGEEIFVAIFSALKQSHRWQGVDADRDRKWFEGLVPMRSTKHAERLLVWCKALFKRLGTLTAVHVDTKEVRLLQTETGWISEGNALAARLMPEDTQRRDFFVLHTEPCGCRVTHHLPWPRNERYADPQTPPSIRNPCPLHEEEHD